MAIKQELAEPDPARLAWRDLIKKTIREVVTQPELDVLIVIQQTVDTVVPESERGDVQAH